MIKTKFPDSADHELDMLENLLQAHESLAGAIEQIEARTVGSTEITESVYSHVTVEIDSLRLLEDPSGNKAPQEGQSLVIRGTAFIKNDKKQVVIFRVS